MNELTRDASSGAAPSFESQVATNQSEGVNRADWRDNFVNGVLYVSELSMSHSRRSC
ncbi:hypothetical protein [Nonomuraea deserti]|uniref:hypothetical protein n=1 Tax=Nonomuraea deserti TaxID=1848322 RepID=UPI00140445B9|nr:hypothetical protein [Nonomuraea deserti]